MLLVLKNSLLLIVILVVLTLWVQLMLIILQSVLMMKEICEQDIYLGDQELMFVQFHEEFGILHLIVMTMNTHI